MSSSNYKSTPSLSYEQANLINDSRILMSRMAYLTRFYIVESITGIGNPEVTFNEILELPLEEKQLIKSVPGFEGSSTSVTSSYLVGLKNIIDAMISKDQAKADESIQKLYEVSDQNAKHLAQLSPYWDESTWRDLFYRYNRNLVAEVLAILTEDYNQALVIFEELMLTALEMGDYYAEGFIHFLPESQNQIPIAYFNMIKDLRQIATEWAYLVRFYMVTKIVGFGDDKVVIQKFFNSINRIKEKTELILGTKVASKFSDSLLIYVANLGQLIDAILSGDQANIDAQTNVVYQFGDQLASYLSSINPYWDEVKWKELFNTLTELVIIQSYNLYRKEYVGAMMNFEKLLYSVLAIADYFAYGLYQYTTLV